MVSALVLSVQLMTAEPALMPPPQPVKLLPVWAPAAVGGATQTLAVLALIGVDSLRRCPAVTKDPCLFGFNFQLGLFISAVAIHAVVAISTGVLGIINAVRVGEAKKKPPPVTFDGVAFHF